MEGRQIYTARQDRWARQLFKESVKGRRNEEILTGFARREAPFDSPDQVKERLPFLRRLWPDDQDDAAHLLSGHYPNVDSELLDDARYWQPVPLNDRIGGWVSSHPWLSPPRGRPDAAQDEMSRHFSYSLRHAGLNLVDGGTEFPLAVIELSLSLRKLFTYHEVLVMLLITNYGKARWQFWFAPGATWPTYIRAAHGGQGTDPAYYIERPIFTSSVYVN